MSEKGIYMDYSATTPVDPLVLRAMLPYFLEKFGNPSSIHVMGRETRQAIDKAREQVAKSIGADPEEIIFTSGGTESDNLGIKGVAYSRKEKGHIITTSIEHAAVRKTCEHLENEGFEVTYLPVDKHGLVSPDILHKAMRKDTFLVSIIFGHNEIGTVQDMAALAKVIHNKGALLHTDAVQAVGKVPVNVKDIGIDLLSLSGHKIYGPKGIGALYFKKGIQLTPLQHGGGHEGRVRSGTENVAAIVGLGEAMELASARLPKDIAHLQHMRDRLIKGIVKTISETYLNGHPVRRLPHNVNIRFAHIIGGKLVRNLDSSGICVSTGSACSSKESTASQVLLAIGLKPEEAYGALRLTLGRNNTVEEVDKVLEVLPIVIEKMRKKSFIKLESGYAN
ncbi:MAG: cysteine desulfurase family protein [bacterium]